jgi:RIO-like serine/threonine protein kinase
MSTEILKRDALGTTRLVHDDRRAVVERDTRTARRGVRWLARRLAAREAAALTALAGVAQVPQLLDFDGAVVRRSYLPGMSLHRAAPPARRYFASALRVLRAVHRAGVTHNDLAKEANWIVAEGAVAGIVDFQLALAPARRDARFRRRAYEDLRHLLKHKRTYQPQHLTARQRRVLAAPTLGTRLWRTLAKPAYLIVTRGLLRWPERSGANERG